jgi:membrane protein
MRKYFTDIYNIWISERPNNLAAALAYYGMFSFAPVIYLAFRFAGRFINQIAIADQFAIKLETLLGPETAALVQDLVQAVSESHTSSSVLFSLISLLALYFAASGLFFQLQYALNTIWKVPPPQKGQTQLFIRKRLFSFLMVIGVGLLLVAAALINVILAWFGSLLETYFGFGNSQAILTWFGTLGLIVISFALLYKVLPDVRIAWRNVWGGASTAALLVMIAGSLATIYFSLGNIGSAFQAAGAFAVILIAIYYIAQIFLLGAIITRVSASRNLTAESDQELASQPV